MTRVSLAPHCVGRLEKGIDYIGNPSKLREDLKGHAAIARALGPYKLSLHSSSDKFSVYPIIVELTEERKCHYFCKHPVRNGAFLSRLIHGVLGWIRIILLLEGDAVAIRGVVISPPIESDETGGAVTSKTIDEAALRQYVLYWDKIDLPDNDLIGYGTPPEIQLLKEEGILQQTLFRVVRPNSGPVLQNLRDLVGYDPGSGDMEIDFGNWFGSKLNAQMQLEAFFSNNQQSGEEWSIAQPNRFLELPQNGSIPSRTVEVELYQAIPVPIADVPMEEVLDFRQRRQDEVLAFRNAMDELYLSIINSSDIPRSKTVAVRKIEQSLADLSAVAKERRWGLERPSLRIGLNPLNLALSMFTNPHKVLSNLDLPAVTEFISGAITSSLNITIGSAVRRPKQIPEHLKAYSYLHYIEKELRR